MRFSVAVMTAVVLLAAVSGLAAGIHQKGIVVSAGAGAGVYPESYYSRGDFGYYGHVSVGYCFDGSNVLSVTRHIVCYEDLNNGKMSWLMWQPLGIEFAHFLGKGQKIATSLGIYSGEMYTNHRSYGLVLGAGLEVARHIVVDLKYRGTFSPRRYWAADNSLLLEVSYQYR
jgi:hypothetical protein